MKNDPPVQVVRDQDDTRWSAIAFARLLGVSTSTLKRWDRDGIAIAGRYPSGKKYYTTAHLEACLGHQGPSNGAYRLFLGERIAEFVATGIPPREALSRANAEWREHRETLGLTNAAWLLEQERALGIHDDPTLVARARQTQTLVDGLAEPATNAWLLEPKQLGGPESPREPPRRRKTSNVAVFQAFCKERIRVHTAAGCSRSEARDKAIVDWAARSTPAPTPAVSSPPHTPAGPAGTSAAAEAPE